MSNQHQDSVPTIVVHGGARHVSDNRIAVMNAGVKEAAIESYRVLQNGGNSVDAVVRAVTMLEDNPHFNAGCGSVLNKNGEIETHALVMRGDTCAVGGVSCLKSIKNPVVAARHAMESSPHCLLDGPASLRLARSHHLQEKSQDYFISERTLQRAKEFEEKMKNWEETVAQQENHDTVGAVALDYYGNIACATSTGGFDGQEVGRISDSPVVGAGGFADNQTAAISTTGHGESIMKISLARMVSMYIESGLTPNEASVKAVEFMKTRINGLGGVIAIDTKGRVGMHFTTENMAWAQIGGQDKTEKTPAKVKYGCDFVNVFMESF